MRVAILADPPDLSAYVGEILKTWGLTLYDIIRPEPIPDLDPTETPVVIRPASGHSDRHASDLVGYAQRGGTVVCLLPHGELAAAAGLRSQGEKETPLRLRVTARPVAGVAGELLPIVGRAETYECISDTDVLAYLSHPGRYGGESVGIVERAVGKGRIVAFAFDLALCVLLERQGDPARAEVIPPGDRCARPSHMAVATGLTDGGWTPFADLVGRMLVDFLRRHLPAPVPLLSHLPGRAAGILLYSGDEDGAEVAWNNDQLDYLAEAGARMNLYIIPTDTNSTQADVERYAAHHDVGPHPDLRPLDGHPVGERLAELERQVRMFRDMFASPVRTVRNHSTVWPGYLAPAELMEKLGIRMDASFISGTYMRGRLPAPYAAFGAAMPMRFCSPEGSLIDVFQQHTHLSDDVMFGQRNYSYRFSPEQFEVILDRILTDVAGRFHTPYAANIHPSNWVKFSRAQGQALLRQADEWDIPVWSFDQWSVFWDVRDTWRCDRLGWDGSRLSFVVEGAGSHEGLSLWLPAEYAGRPLRELDLDDKPTDWHRTTRYREPTALVAIPSRRSTISVTARYGRNTHARARCSV